VSGWELHRIAKETASGGVHDVGSSQQTSGEAKKNSNGKNPSLFLVLTGSDVGFSRFLGGKNTTM